MNAEWEIIGQKKAATEAKKAATTPKWGNIIERGKSHQKRGIDEVTQTNEYVSRGCTASGQRPDRGRWPMNIFLFICRRFPFPSEALAAFMKPLKPIWRSCKPPLKASCKPPLKASSPEIWILHSHSKRGMNLFTDRRALPKMNWKLDRFSWTYKFRSYSWIFWGFFSFSFFFARFFRGKKWFCPLNNFHAVSMETWRWFSCASSSLILPS